MSFSCAKRSPPLNGDARRASTCTCSGVGENAGAPPHRWVMPIKQPASESVSCPAGTVQLGTETGRSRSRCDRPTASARLLHGFDQQGAEAIDPGVDRGDVV